jgi:hypothetical protein
MGVTGSLLRPFMALYTHPIVTGIITLMLASAAFLSGIITSLGTEFVPLIRKEDLLSTLFLYLLFVMAAAGALRLFVLILYEQIKPWLKFKATPELKERIPEFRYFVPQLLTILGCVLGIFTLLLILRTVLSAYTVVIVLFVLFCATILTLLGVLYVYLRGSVVLFVAQLTFLVSMFGLGNVWIAVQRERPAGLQVQFEDGATVSGNVVFTSSEGLIMFVANAPNAHFFAWDHVEKITLLTTESGQASSDDIKAIVRWYCSLSRFIAPDCDVSAATEPRSAR